MLRRMSFAVIALLTCLTAWASFHALQNYYRQPAIGIDLPKRFQAADAELRRRVADILPLPLAQDELRLLLTIQGFDVAPNNGEASFEKSGWPCQQRWRLSWDENLAVVNAIDIRSGLICL